LPPLAGSEEELAALPDVVDREGVGVVDKEVRDLEQEKEAGDAEQSLHSHPTRRKHVTGCAQTFLFALSPPLLVAAAVLPTEAGGEPGMCKLGQARAASSSFCCAGRKLE